MNLRWILDKEQGARLRSVVVIVSAVVTLVGEFLADVDGAAGVVTVPLILTYLGRFTTIGDRP